jgi:hypothetical protein
LGKNAYEENKMTERIINLFLYLIWGAFNGLALLLANWFVSFMWRLSSRDGVSRVQAILLYIGVQVGGVLIIGAYLCIVFAFLDSFYSSTYIAEPLVMVFASILFIFVSVKRKWFRPAVTTLNEFLHTKPSNL